MVDSCCQWPVLICVVPASRRIDVETPGCETSRLQAFAESGSQEPQPDDSNVRPRCVMHRGRPLQDFDIVGGIRVRDINHGLCRVGRHSERLTSIDRNHGSSDHRFDLGYRPTATVRARMHAMADYNRFVIWLVHNGEIECHQTKNSRKPPKHVFFV